MPKNIFSLAMFLKSITILSFCKLLATSEKSPSLAACSILAKALFLSVVIFAYFLNDSSHLFSTSVRFILRFLFQECHVFLPCLRPFLQVEKLTHNNRH